MATVRSLFLLVVATLVAARSAPAKYDQRQEGDFNVQAHLKNFLFLIVYGGNGNGDDHGSLLGDLALQALELKQQLSSRSSTSSSGSRGAESSAGDKPARGEEPYSVEIIRIDEKDPSRDAQAATDVVVSIGESGKGEEVANRTGKSARGFFEFAKNGVPSPLFLGYLANGGRAHAAPDTEDGGRVRSVWNYGVDYGRAGASLKKQLLRGENAEAVAPTSKASVVDNAASVQEKRQEPKPLANGIESCGPGRRRDASGICRPFDGSTGSLL